MDRYLPSNERRVIDALCLNAFFDPIAHPSSCPLQIFILLDLLPNSLQVVRINQIQHFRFLNHPPSYGRSGNTFTSFILDVCTNENSQKVIPTNYNRPACSPHLSITRKVRDIYAPHFGLIPLLRDPGIFELAICCLCLRNRDLDYADLRDLVYKSSVGRSP